MFDKSGRYTPWRRNEDIPLLGECVLNNIEGLLPKCNSSGWEWEEDNRPDMLLGHLGRAEVRIKYVGVKIYGTRGDCFEWIICDFETRGWLIRILLKAKTVISFPNAEFAQKGQKNQKAQKNLKNQKNRNTTNLSKWNWCEITQPFASFRKFINGACV